MLHRVIREILLSIYGDTHQLQFLMRPQTKIYRFLITKELLKQYITITEARNRSHQADFYHAVASDIEEALEHWSPDRIAVWLSLIHI